ncbi:hypothetical protein KKA53_01575 [Candidatus Dependentiae bacterium]|nr:hypothetical protein [Candidatus Dependentiae bacterium]
MNKKLLFALLLLTTHQANPVQLKPKKIKPGKLVTIKETPVPPRLLPYLGDLIPKTILEKLAGIRLVSERTFDEVKRDLVEFYGLIDPTKHGLSPDPGLNPMFKEFQDLVEHVKMVMGGKEKGPKTGKPVKTEMLKESFNYAQSLVIQNLLGGDKNKLKTIVGKQHLKRFEDESVFIHYDILNEVLFLEKEIFYMLQAIALEAAEQSYLAKVDVAFTELTEIYSERFAGIEKQLNKVITTVLGPKEGGRDFQLVWKALLTKKYPIKIDISDLVAKNFPNRVKIYQKFINNRTEIYQRLVYTAMEKLATVLTMLDLDPKTTEKIINQYIKMAEPYIKRPKKFLGLKFKKNQFDLWKENTDKSVGDLAIEIVGLDCYHNWESYPKCKNSIEWFDIALKKADDGFQELFERAKEEFRMATLLDLIQKELTGKEKIIPRGPETKKELNKKFEALRKQEEEQERKEEIRLKKHESELDKTRKKWRQTINDRRNTEEKLLEKMKTKWEKSGGKEIPKETKVEWQEERESRLRQPGGWGKWSKAGKEKNKRGLLEEIETARKKESEYSTKRRDIEKIGEIIKEYPLDEIEKVRQITRGIDRKTDTEVENLKKQLKLSLDVQKLKNEFNRYEISRELDLIDKVVTESKPKDFEKVEQKLIGLKYKDNEEIRKLAKELAPFAKITPKKDLKKNLFYEIDARQKKEPENKSIRNALGNLKDIVERYPTNKIDDITPELRNLESMTDPEIMMLSRQLRTLLNIENTREQKERQKKAAVLKALETLKEYVMGYPTKEFYEIEKPFENLTTRTNEEIIDIVRKVAFLVSEETKETRAELIDTERRRAAIEKMEREQKEELEKLRNQQKELQKLKDELRQERTKAQTANNEKVVQGLSKQLDVLEENEYLLRKAIQKLMEDNEKTRNNLDGIEQDLGKVKHELWELMGAQRAPMGP